MLKCDAENNPGIVGTVAVGETAVLPIALYVQDHLVHFYQLSALDWVDVVSALSADPPETSEIQQ